MNHLDWLKKDDARVAWSETWKLPHMKEGLDVLTQIGLPRAKEVPPGFTGVEWNALQNARREGFFEALSLIDLLKKEPVPPPVELPREWAHIIIQDDL